MATWTVRTPMRATTHATGWEAEPLRAMAEKTRTRNMSRHAYFRAKIPASPQKE